MRSFTGFWSWNLDMLVARHQEKISSFRINSKTFNSPSQKTTYHISDWTSIDGSALDNLSLSDRWFQNPIPHKTSSSLRELACLSVSMPSICLSSWSHCWMVGGCSLNRSPFSISSLNHHSSLSKGPKLYACQSGPLSKDEVDDWHRMKCHLGILTRSWESECTMYLGQGICIKWHLSNWCCCDKERINVNLDRILIALLCFF